MQKKNLEIVAGGESAAAASKRVAVSRVSLAAGAAPVRKAVYCGAAGSCSTADRNRTWATWAAAGVRKSPRAIPPPSARRADVWCAESARTAAAAAQSCVICVVVAHCLANFLWCRKKNWAVLCKKSEIFCVETCEKKKRSSHSSCTC
jgi:hypothetical protein